VRNLMLSAFAVFALSGCASAEYLCPEGLVPLEYSRHTDHAQTFIGRHVEVHSSDLKCERFSDTRHGL